MSSSCSWDGRSLTGQNSQSASAEATLHQQCRNCSHGLFISCYEIFNGNIWPFFDFDRSDLSSPCLAPLSPLRVFAPEEGSQEVGNATFKILRSGWRWQCETMTVLPHYDVRRSLRDEPISSKSPLRFSYSCLDIMSQADRCAFHY